MFAKLDPPVAARRTCMQCGKRLRNAEALCATCTAARSKALARRTNTTPYDVRWPLAFVVGLGGMALALPLAPFAGAVMVGAIAGYAVLDSRL